MERSDHLSEESLFEIAEDRCTDPDALKHLEGCATCQGELEDLRWSVETAAGYSGGETPEWMKELDFARILAPHAKDDDSALIAAALGASELVDRNDVSARAMSQHPSRRRTRVVPPAFILSLKVAALSALVVTMFLVGDSRWGGSSERPWNGRGWGTPKGPAASVTAVRDYDGTRRWAVIIGVSEQNPLGIDAGSRLSYAASDAGAVWELLIGALGYETDRVSLLTNRQATSASIRYALTHFLAEVKPGDHVLVFFSGHGLPDQTLPGQVYLQTYDTNSTDLPGTAMTIEEVQLLLDVLPTEDITLVLDACRSGAISPVDKSFWSSTNGIAVLSSSRPDEVSNEYRALRAGLFTHFLIQGLEGAADGSRDGIVELKELGEYVTREVGEYSGGAQNPAVQIPPVVEERVMAVVLPDETPNPLKTPSLGVVPVLATSSGLIDAPVRLDGIYLGSIQSTNEALLIANVRPAEYTLSVGWEFSQTTESTIEVVPGANSLKIFAEPVVASMPPRETTTLPEAANAPETTNTVCIYNDRGQGNARHWMANGFMPDGNGIMVDEGHRIGPYSGSTCIKIEVAPNRAWSGVYILPKGMWGDWPGIDLVNELNLSSDSEVELSFWARSDGGVTKCEFKSGGVTRGKYPDSIRFPASSGVVELSDEWERFSISLDGKDLSNVVGALCVIVRRDLNPNGAVVLLDDTCFDVISN